MIIRSAGDELRVIVVCIGAAAIIILIIHFNRHQPRRQAMLLSTKGKEMQRELWHVFQKLFKADLN